MKKLLLILFLFSTILIKANNCSAESTLGGSCSIECPNDDAKCSGGLFKANCKCGTIMPHDFNITIDNIQIDRYNMLIQFAVQSNPTIVNNLNDAISSLKTAVLHKSFSEYDTATDNLKNLILNEANSALKKYLNDMSKSIGVEEQL